MSEFFNKESDLSPLASSAEEEDGVDNKAPIAPPSPFARLFRVSSRLYPFSGVCFDNLMPLGLFPSTVALLVLFQGGLASASFTSLS